jgi:site-specific DNA-methyltransferase (adenine-specific)
MSHAELAWTNLDLPVRCFRMAFADAYKNKAEFPKQHPCEKPMQLMRWCISLAGDVADVLDPFMGVGTTLRAAKLLGKRAIGIEADENYCRIAVERLRQSVFAFGGTDAAVSDSE